MNFKIDSVLNHRLFKNSTIFIGSDILNKSIPFLLLPVLTKYLTPEDYGVIASFNSLLTILAVFVGLSVHGAVNVNYYKLAKNELKIFIGNIVLLLVLSTILTSILILIFRFKLELLLKFPWKWFFAAILTSFCSFISLINLTLWIAEQKPKEFGLFNILDTLLKLGMSLFFIVILGYNWKGRAISMVIATVIMSLINLYVLYRRGYLRLNFSIYHISDALKFGIPLMPHQLSMWLRDGAIVLILVNLIGQSQTGLYDVGFKIASIIGFVTAAFNKAYQPYLFRKLKEIPTIKEKKIIVRFFYLYCISLLAFASLLTISSPWIIYTFLDSNFLEAYKYVGYLCFAATFQGMYFMVSGYIFYEKKTKYLAYITFVVSAFQICLAYVLIKHNGALGAAQASMVSFFLSFIAVWYYSNKIYKMPWLSIK